MTLLEKMIAFTRIQGQTPTNYGKLHLNFIFAVLILCIVCVTLFKDTTDGGFRILIGVMFFAMLTGELIKQIFYPLSIVDGQIIKDYDWATFPFQLCSTPLYVLPLLILLPDCKVRDFAAAYIMGYGLLGGLAVYISPNAIFVSNMFLSCHSLVHHGLQILTGVYTASYYRRRINTSFILGGVGIFVIMFAIANIINTVVYDAWIAKGILFEGDAFNMFYISPRPGQRPMAFKKIYYAAPIAYIACYFLIITAGALILILATKLWRELARRRTASRAAKR